MKKTTTTTKKTVKQEFIERILAHIEKEHTMPWNNGLLNKRKMPINFLTGKKYRGVNILSLWMDGGGTDEYATFNQINEAGGKVKKGSKGIPIVFYKLIQKEDVKTMEDEEGNILQTLPEYIPMLKKFTVFKLTDCEGVKGRREFKTQENPVFPNIQEAVERFFSATNLKYNESSGTAYYTPFTHSVTISARNEYTSSERYYKTLFHEMVHSTAISMKRDLNGRKESTAYSKEEVIAEFGSMLLCRAFGIACEENQEISAEYIKGWSESLRKNPDWLISGASKADKAVEYIIDKMGLWLDEEGIAQEPIPEF